MPAPSRGELPIIQATMDLIQWFVPLLNRLPRDHRFALGDRFVHGLYDLLEGLVAARYATAKLDASNRSMPASISCACRSDCCTPSS